MFKRPLGGARLPPRTGVAGEHNNAAAARGCGGSVQARKAAHLVVGFLRRGVGTVAYGSGVVREGGLRVRSEIAEAAHEFG